MPLPGYPGGSDVVTGNWVTGQFQLDAAGEILQLLATAARWDQLDDARQAAHVAIELVENRWRHKEAGIWESHDAWWTHSRLACVAGLRAIAHHLAPGPAGRASGLGDAILAETSRRCLDGAGAGRRSTEKSGVDAALPPSTRSGTA